MKQGILLFFFLTTNFISAQTVSTDLNILKKPEFNRAIIYFNDGSSLEGVGRLKTIFTSREEVIIFKIDENDKDETWTYKDVNGITIIYDEGVIHYEYLKSSKYSFPELYEVVTEGTIKLYKKRFVMKEGKFPSVNNNQMFFNSSGTINPTNTNPSIQFPAKEIEKSIYYLKKETEEFPTKIKDNYIKSFAEYMKDCDYLVEDIRNHKYNLSQFKNLVDEYNANCGE